MMLTLTRPQKIAFGELNFAEMRAAGVSDVLVYCADYRCSHWTHLDADRWARLGSRQIIASRLLGQKTQEPACDNELFDGFRIIEELRTRSPR